MQLNSQKYLEIRILKTLSDTELSANIMLTIKYRLQNFTYIVILHKTEKGSSTEGNIMGLQVSHLISVILSSMFSQIDAMKLY